MELVEAAATPPIPENLLRDWLKKTQVLLPPSPKPPESLDPNSIEVLLNGLLETAYAPTLTARHRAAACNFVCAIFDLSFSQHGGRLETALIHLDAWRRMFSVFIERSDVSMAKSMRQVLTTLTNALKIKYIPAVERTRLRDEAIVSALEIVQESRSLSLVKPALQIITQFLSKEVLTLHELLLVRVGSNQSLSDVNLHQAHGTITTLYESVFSRVRLNDLALSAAQLSTELTRHVVAWVQQNGGSNPPLWEEPLLRVLRRSPESLMSFRTHVFPPLFRIDVSGYFELLRSCGLHKLPDRSSMPDNSIIGSQTDTEDHSVKEEVLYASLHVGKEVGIVRDVEDDPIRFMDNAHVIVPTRTIRALLRAQRSTVRLAGLSLAISSPSTTLPFNGAVLRSLRSSLPLLFCETDTSFRGDLISMMQRLLDRLRGASAHLFKTAKKNSLESQSKDCTNQPSYWLEQHRVFTTWLFKLALSELNPAATYQSHYTALRVLTMFAKSGIDPCVASRYHSKHGQLDLTWPFLMNLFTPWLTRSLLDLLLDPYDDVRQAAAFLLSMCPERSTNNIALVDDLHALFDRAESLAQHTGRADHADGVGRICALLYERLPVDVAEQVPLSDRTLSKRTLFESLLLQLESDLAIAHRSLADAVRASPLHANLIAISYILSCGQLYGVPHGSDGSITATWRDMYRHLVSSMAQIWEIVRPVLCDDAPEGYVFEEAEEIQDITTKDTLSYCWRALKESSSLIKVLVIESTKLKYSDGALFTMEELEMLGDLSFNQLSELRHRGAFSTVAQTFAVCCSWSYNSIDRSSRKLIDGWYGRTLDAIIDKASALTRRSAGLPSLLTGILSVDPERSLFGETVTVLITISQEAPSTQYERGDPLPQVHAMNCLRAVFINSKLGISSERFVLKALHLAASRLGSRIWAIRNSALMLFRALIDRMLGTFASGSSEEAIISSRFSYSTYPGLLNIIEDLLHLEDSDLALGTSSSVSSATAAALEKVFPALHLLQRAPPPSISRRRLIPPILKLTRSAQWHVRDLAARTLVRLTDDMSAQQLHTLFPPTTFEGPIHQNELHGFLLVFHYLIRYRFMSGVHDEATARDLGYLKEQVLGNRVQLISLRQNTCWVTQAAFSSLADQVNAIRPMMHDSDSVGMKNDPDHSAAGEDYPSLFDISNPPSRVERTLVAWTHHIEDLAHNETNLSKEAEEIQHFAGAVRTSLEEDNSLALRLAAMRSLSGLCTFWRVAAMTPECSNAALSLLLSTYDALRDDDAEIRDLAAHVVREALQSSNTHAVQPRQSPPRAAQDLVIYLTRRFNHHTRLCTEAVIRLTSRNITIDGVQQFATQIIDKSFEEATTLFVKEKQNLYIDLVHETTLWSKVLKQLSTRGISKNSAQLLTAWVIDGLDYLTKTVMKFKDGALGWSSKPEVFATGVQLICAADILLSWRARTWKVPASGSELRMKLYTLYLAGRDANLHPMWLEKLDLVLAQAVTRKIVSLKRALSIVLPTDRAYERVLVTKEPPSHA